MVIPPISMITQSSFVSWMLQWLTEATDDVKAMPIQGLYALLLAKNNAHSGKKIEDPWQIARGVTARME